MLAAAVILAAAAAFLPAAPVWITDNGNKYMIMRNFAATGSLEISHRIPEVFPTGGFHFVRTEKGYRSFYPEIFPVLTSYVYRFTGGYAVTVIPLLCGVLLAGAAAGAFRSFTAGMLTLFAAPCFFYSLLLWEMIPAVLAGFAGVMLLRDRKFLAGGIILGLGLFLREELYFLGAAAGAVLLFQKQWKALLCLSGGFICGMIPVWLVQYLLTGHVLGFHGANYYLNNRTGFDLKEEIAGVFWNYYHHLFRFETARYLLIPVIFMLLTALCRRDDKVRQVRLLIISGAGVLFLCGAVKFMTSSGLCYASTVNAGFISTLPLCWLFWCCWKDMLFSGPWKNRFLAGVVIAYTLLVPPLMTRHDVGLFWGARHFLFIMPFAVYLSLKALKFMPQRKYLLCALAALSLFWQFCGFSALSQVSEESSAFTRSVLAYSPQIVASDVFFLPEQAPELFFERTFCGISGEKQLDELVKYMKKNKIKDFVFISSPRRTQLGRKAVQKLERMTVVKNFSRFQSGSSGFMDMVIMELQLVDRR